LRLSVALAVHVRTFGVLSPIGSSYYDMVAGAVVSIQPASADDGSLAFTTAPWPQRAPANRRRFAGKSNSQLFSMAAVSTDALSDNPAWTTTQLSDVATENRYGELADGAPACRREQAPLNGLACGRADRRSVAAGRADDRRAGRPAPGERRANTRRLSRDRHRSSRTS